MAKYVVVDEVEVNKGGEIYTTEFDELLDAIAEADRQWDQLSDHDKKRRDAFYVLESANPDPEADNHLDGDPLKEYFYK